jgi:hypothetical protein
VRYAATVFVSHASMLQNIGRRHNILVEAQEAGQQ